jgi:hypothetical protein
VPEEAEGITACVWHPVDEASTTVSYDNARDVLKQAAEMHHALVQTGVPRSRHIRSYRSITRGGKPGSRLNAGIRAAPGACVCAAASRPSSG